jgi:hypothetical protein
MNVDWMRVAEDRARWQEVGEAYVQQWTVVVMMMIMDLSQIKYTQTYITLSVSL